MTKPSKTRLDQLLCDRELVESRSKAKALILAGQALVNNTVIDKAGTLVPNDAEIRLKTTLKYVSRGGLKLEKALTEFSIQPQNFVCLDIGASTGGFTDCLLQAGANKVYAVDVGYGQMHWKLQSDARVHRIDRCNFRTFDLQKFTDRIDLVVSDVSFISILKIAPKILELTKSQDSPLTWITLFKPQFEVGPEFVGKGGIVKDDKAREESLNSTIFKLEKLGFHCTNKTTSPITGSDGNIEYLLLLTSIEQNQI